MRREIMLLAAVLVCAGCALPHRLQVGDRSGPGNKTVVAKEEPATLVAVDGSLCHTTPNKFDDAKIGDRVWCYWRQRGEGPDIGGRVGPGPITSPDA